MKSESETRSGTGTGTSESAAFMKELRREIEAHPGVNHLFLNRCATSPFAREDYRVFGENHFPLVCVFTSYLERLLVRAPTSDAKLWLAKVILTRSRGQSDYAAITDICIFNSNSIGLT